MQRHFQFFRWASLSASFTLLLFLAGCIGTDTFDDLSEGSERVELIGPTEDSDFDQLAIGQSLSYEARFFNGGGVEEDASFNWSVKDDAIASVNADGVLTGLNEGSTMIVVSANGASAERLVLVASTERIQINAPQSFVLVGSDLQLTAVYFDENGTEVQTEISWASSAASFGTVNSDGLVSGLAKGMTEITASANGMESQPLRLNIIDQIDAVAEVIISAPSNVVAEGGQLPLQLTVRDGAGQNLTGKSANWTTSNPAIITVNNQGVVTANSPGVAEISATVDGVTSAPFEIIVTAAMATSRCGDFVGVGSYNVQGKVTINEISNGIELDFSSSFSSSTGPGLYVYLSNSQTGGFSVASLPQNSGSFTLEVPDVSLEEYDFVLIWCEPFGVTFGYAELN